MEGDRTQTFLLSLNSYAALSTAELINVVTRRLHYFKQTCTLKAKVCFQEYTTNFV